MIGALRDLPEEDGDRPEEWVGSTVRARNPDDDEPEAGLSRLEDGRLLRDAVAEDPAYWGEPAVLVKLLDPANRLPVHAHPDRAFASEHLGSAHGKTEAWIVVATRDDDAEVWVGLREEVDRDEYRGWIERQDREALLGSLNQLRVRAGDTVYVPAGVPHAIGAGALIVELQEPTDFSIVCEWDGFPIAPEEAHLGLGWDRTLDALRLDAHDPVLGLPEESRAFFEADDRAEPAGRLAVLLVVDGKGELGGLPARAGDAFVIPAAADEFDVRGDLRVLRCMGGST
jgi:mannose-6-phosphate isomerase